MFLKRKMNDSMNGYSDKILQIKEKIQVADAVVIGAGAGFSTSAGFVHILSILVYRHKKWIKVI